MTGGVWVTGYWALRFLLLRMMWSTDHLMVDLDLDSVFFAEMVWSTIILGWIWVCFSCFTG